MTTSVLAAVAAITLAAILHQLVRLRRARRRLSPGASHGERLPAAPSAAGLLPPPGSRVRVAATPSGVSGPGVFRVEASAAGDELGRGREAAERLLRGGLGRGLRRGKKAALDVIVVGASLAGASAALHLLGAGLRVLVVDERPEVAPPAALPAELRALLRRLPRTRVPLAAGHRVTSVVERPDGMLELHAERAAWYTANVLFVGEASAAQAA